MQSQFYDKITISLIIKFRAASREWKVVEHVRERKSNAAKQFAYNKLKTKAMLAQQQLLRSAGHRAEMRHSGRLNQNLTLNRKRKAC